MDNYTTSIENIFGTIIHIGINLYVEIKKGYNVPVRANGILFQDIKFEIGNYVHLRGKATWDSQTQEINKFELIEIFEYQQGNVSKTFKEIREFSSGNWDRAKTIQEINDILLRD